MCGKKISCERAALKTNAFKEKNEKTVGYAELNSTSVKPTFNQPLITNHKPKNILINYEENIDPILINDSKGYTLTEFLDVQDIETILIDCKVKDLGYEVNQVLNMFKSFCKWNSTRTLTLNL